MTVTMTMAIPARTPVTRVMELPELDPESLMSSLLADASGWSACGGCTAKTDPFLKLPKGRAALSFDKIYFMVPKVYF